MKPVDRVQMVLDAIDSVKVRIKAATASGDLLEYKRLMGDLLALECSLVPEARALVDDINKIA